MTVATSPTPAPRATGANTSAPSPPPRLLSLDVYRGLVIFAMLVVNNLGDYATTGYIWKHADWPEPWLGESFRLWWEGLTTGGLPWYGAFTQFPLFRHCTLADYVMPSFMLIIGLAIPYSVAASVKRGVPAGTMWFRTVKRAATLVVLGWVLCYFRDQFAGWFYGSKPFAVSFGMDVLQLLGVAYLVARVLYELPKYPRIVAAVVLFVWHWGLLRFLPQGDVPAGTFTEKHNAVGYAYAHWRIWGMLTLHPTSWLTIGWAGLLSVPPAVATMLLGTVAGDFLRREDVAPGRKIRTLAVWGAITAVVGAAWAFDLPFNKPRWTPCYLMWVAGVGFVLIAGLYWLIDVRGVRRGTYAFVVFGSNAIAAYFLSILAKVLLLNTPRVSAGDPGTNLTNSIILAMKTVWTTAFTRCGVADAGWWGSWAGGWTFTLLFVATWWGILNDMYRKKVFWKL